MIYEIYPMNCGIQFWTHWVAGNIHLMSVIVKESSIQLLSPTNGGIAPPKIASRVYSICIYITNYKGESIQEYTIVSKWASV